MMKKPNLNTIIANNLNKTGHISNPGLGSMPNKKATVPFMSEQGYKQGLPPAGSHYRIPSDTLYNPTPYRIKAKPNNGPAQWLEPYTNENVQFPGAEYVDEQHFQNGGNYLSDRAQATQFGQYKRGGGIFPPYHSFTPPRMSNGGGLLSRKVTCSNCGWSWKGVDGGKDVMTCHKCGGMIKMQDGGANELNQYQVAGQVPTQPAQQTQPAAPAAFDPVTGVLKNSPNVSPGNYSQRLKYYNQVPGFQFGQRPTINQILDHQVSQPGGIKTYRKNFKADYPFGTNPAVPKQQYGGDPSISDLDEYQIGGWLNGIVDSGKKYINNAVNTATHTDPVNFIPFGSHLPANAKAFTRFVASNLGLGQDVPFVQKKDFTPAQLKVIKQAALNAQKRTGKPTGGTKYSDYGKKYSHVWNNPSQLLTDPTKVAQTTIGRSNYKVNPNNQVAISDNYDFANEISTRVSNPIKKLVHTGLEYLNSSVPENDPRRNINFDVYAKGGITVDVTTTKPSGIVGTFFNNVNKITKLISSDSDKKSNKETTTETKNKKTVETAKNYISKYGQDYINLMEAYGLDPFSKEGILKAQKLSKSNPKIKIVCTAQGCAEIATNAAHAFGNNFVKANAWDLGNKNKVVATNPIYADAIGKGILNDPTNYSSPSNLYNRAGAIIGLNRRNNSVEGKASIKKMANDSYDYANQDLYPNSRGYEHVGYMLDDNTLLHGTGEGSGHPAYYTLDSDLSNGAQLTGYGSYQPVEAITPGSAIAAASSAILDTVKGLFKKQGGETKKTGGWLDNHL